MNMACVFSLGAAFLFSGCAVSVCQAPVGDSPLDIANEAKEWEGLWLLHMGKDAYPNPPEDVTVPVRFEVTDSTNGMLRVHLLCTDKDLSDLQPFYDVYLRKAEDWVFASVEFRDKQTTNSPLVYVWGRVRKNKRIAYLWWASAPILDALQKQGKAPSALPSYTSLHVLSGLNSNHIAQIMSPTNPVPLIWESPLLFIKQD